MEFIGDLEFWSRTCGSLSLLFFVIVCTPQIIENYRQKSGQSLSYSLIAFWAVADLFGFWGLFYVNWLVTQMIMHAFFFLMDITLIGQCIYYNYFYHQKSTADHGEETTGINDDDDSNKEVEPPKSVISAHHRDNETREFPKIDEKTSLLSRDGTPCASNQRMKTSAAPFLMIPVLCSLVQVNAMPTSSNKDNQSSININSNNISSLTPDQFGLILGYISATLYTLSRIPQIYKNYQGQSVEGLALGMFLFGALGNIFYIASVLLHSVEWHYLVQQAPWILGCSSTLLFDLVIFAQFYYYRGKPRRYIRIDESSEES